VAGRVDYDKGAAVAILHPVATDEFSEDGIGVGHKKAASMMPVWDIRRPAKSIGRKARCMGSAGAGGGEGQTVSAR
jgi:hypothetical protein